MARGLLIVESRPASPEEAAAYHDWYDNKHVPEILQLEGFVSARRLEAVGWARPLLTHSRNPFDYGREARRLASRSRTG